MERVLQRQNLIKLVIDVGIFIAFLLVMEPRLTGITIHEWLSVAGSAAFIVHLLLNWNWIVEITRRFFGKVSGQARVNYVLNWLLFIDGVLIMLSGLLISEVVLPAFGMRLEMGFFWRRLHSLTADAFVLILGLHIALHWRWIISTTKRCLLGIVPARQKPQATTSSEVQA